MFINFTTGQLIIKKQEDSINNSISINIYGYFIFFKCLVCKCMSYWACDKWSGDKMTTLIYAM